MLIFGACKRNIENTKAPIENNVAIIWYGAYEYICSEIGSGIIGFDDDVIISYRKIKYLR